jgi:hypothetical protein
MTWLTIVECLSYRWPRICPVCRSHNSVPLHSSPNMTDRRDFNIINTTCATRTAYPSAAPRFTHGFEWDLCSLIFLCSVLWAIVRFFVIFHLTTIVLTVLLRFTASDNFSGTLNTLLKRIMLSTFLSLLNRQYMCSHCYILFDEIDQAFNTHKNTYIS